MQKYSIFFFVTEDVIAQILNIYFHTKIPEDKVAFNEKLINKITEKKVKEVIQKFYQETKTARDLRKSFVHRFPSNYPDYRSKFELKEKKIVHHGGSGSFVPPSVIIINIENSLMALSLLMSELKTHMVNVIVLKDQVILTKVKYPNNPVNFYYPVQSAPEIPE